MTAFVRRATSEIASDPALRLYGVALALTHALTYLFWAPNGVLLPMLADRAGNPPLCWPFFPNCGAVEIPYLLLHALSLAYITGTLGVAWAFAAKRVAVGWWGLFALTAFKWCLLMLDYRAMGNYHYMPFLATFAYLLVPGKRVIVTWLIVAFYVAAGSIKLNAEWLTGQALFGQPMVRGIWLEWLCLGAVLIELVFVWGLLAERRVLRGAAFAVLVVFHVFSYHIVGYFYPVMMALLLAIFPLAWFIPSDRPRRLVPIHFVVLGLFAVAQAIPRLQDGDPALVSRGRLYALDMFDALARCQSTLIVKYEGASYEVPAVASRLAPRIACDPIVYWNEARQLCRENAGRAGFKDVDLLLIARRNHVTEETPVMAFRDFCRRDPGYNTLLANAWIDP